MPRHFAKIERRGVLFHNYILNSRYHTLVRDYVDNTNDFVVDQVESLNISIIMRLVSSLIFLQRYFTIHITWYNETI